MIDRRNFMVGTAAAAGVTLATPAILYAHGRGEFAEFFANRNPERHILCDALCNAAEEAINQGGGKHHAFYTPRNIGKTTIFSHALPAWVALTTGNRSIIVARTMDVATQNKRAMVRQALADHYLPYEGVNEHMSGRCHHTAPGNILAGFRGDLIVIDADEMLNSGRQRLWQESLLQRLSPNGTLITVTSSISNLTGITSKTIVKGFV